MTTKYRSLLLRSLLGATALGLVAASAPAFAADPIKIGVIAEAQAIAGASIPQAAQLAADEINAKGGVDGRQIEIITYDNHSSSADSVRAFQRAVNEDKVNIVIASYISEVVLALEPWASRLKTPFITPGAASNEISKSVHADYEKNKYTFHGYLTSAALALSVCDAAFGVDLGGGHLGGLRDRGARDCLGFSDHTDFDRVRRLCQRRGRCHQAEGGGSEQSLQ